MLARVPLIVHALACPPPPFLQLVSINWIAVFRSCFMLLFLAYPGVSLKVLRIFKCRNIDGQSYLEADMRLQVCVWHCAYPSCCCMFCVVHAGVLYDQTTCVFGRAAFSSHCSFCPWLSVTVGHGPSSPKRSLLSGGMLGFSIPYPLCSHFPPPHPMSCPVHPVLHP
jgi:hypothetical protein